MLITIIGPNLRAGESFHAHAAGCADLRKALYAYAAAHDERHTYEAASMQEIVEDTFCDILAENPGTTWEDHAAEIRFFPCTDALPTEG